MQAGAWYGLSKDGEQRMLTADAMARWATDHEQQFQVGWANHFTFPDGTRMVRGEDAAEMVGNAKTAGWHDLASMLAKAFGVAA